MGEATHSGAWPSSVIVSKISSQRTCNAVAMAWLTSGLGWRLPYRKRLMYCGDRCTRKARRTLDTPLRCITRAKLSHLTEITKRARARSVMSAPKIHHVSKRCQDFTHSHARAIEKPRRRNAARLPWV